MVTKQRLEQQLKRLFIDTENGAPYYELSAQIVNIMEALEIEIPEVVIDPMPVPPVPPETFPVDVFDLYDNNYYPGEIE